MSGAIPKVLSQIEFMKRGKNAVFGFHRRSQKEKLFRKAKDATRFVLQYKAQNPCSQKDQGSRISQSNLQQIFDKKCGDFKKHFNKKRDFFILLFV